MTAGNFEHSDRAIAIRDEILALAGLKSSPGLTVIVNKLESLTSNTDTVPLNETNWSLKRAHADGYKAGLKDFAIWLEGCLTAVVDDDGRVVRRREQNSLSERKRRTEA